MRCICLLFTLFIILAGCSGGVDSPVSPIDKHTDTMDNVPIIGVSSYGENFTAIGLMGAYELIINPDDMTADLITKRSSAIGEGYIVSGMSFFTMWPCSNCLKLTSIALDANENAVLSFDVTHPFPPGNMNEPPTAMNRLDLDIFDVALVIAPQDGTTEAYPLTGVDTYPDICVDADGYTRDLLYVTGNNAALPYFLVIDDSETGVSTWNKLEMGESTDFNVKFALTDTLTFDMYQTFGYGFSAVRAQRLTPKYYNPEFNRKAAWKVEVIPPGPAEMGSTWDDGDDTTEYDIEIHVWNWQQGATVYPDPTDFDNAPDDNIYAPSDVASVSVEIPGMTSALLTETDPLSGTGMPDDPLVYSIPIANENLLPEGQYHGIVKVTDQRSPGTIGDRDFLIDTPDGVILNNYEMVEYATYQTFVADIVSGAAEPVGNVTITTNPYESFQWSPIWLLDLERPWTLRWDPVDYAEEYAIYCDFDPSDGLGNDYQFVGVTNDTFYDVPSEHYPPDRYVVGNTYIVRARSVAGDPSSEAPDSEQAFISVNSWDTMRPGDPANGEGWYKHSEANMPHDIYYAPWLRDTYDSLIGNVCFFGINFGIVDSVDPPINNRWQGITKETPVLDNATVRWLEVGLRLDSGVRSPSGLIFGTTPEMPLEYDADPRPITWAPVSSEFPYTRYNAESPDVAQTYAGVPDTSEIAWSDMSGHFLWGGDVNLNGQHDHPYVGIYHVDLTHSEFPYVYLSYAAIIIY